MICILTSSLGFYMSIIPLHSFWYGMEHHYYQLHISLAQQYEAVMYNKTTEREYMTSYLFSCFDFLQHEGMHHTEEKIQSQDHREYIILGRSMNKYLNIGHLLFCSSNGFPSLSLSQSRLCLKLTYFSCLYKNFSMI